MRRREQSLTSGKAQILLHSKSTSSTVGERLSFWWSFFVRKPPSSMTAKRCFISKKSGPCLSRHLAMHLNHRRKGWAFFYHNIYRNRHWLYLFSTRTIQFDANKGCKSFITIWIQYNSFSANCLLAWKSCCACAFNAACPPHRGRWRDHSESLCNWLRMKLPRPFSYSGLEMKYPSLCEPRI